MNGMGHTINIDKDGKKTRSGICDESSGSPRG